MNHFVFIATCPLCGECHAKRIDNETVEDAQWALDAIRKGYLVRQVTVAEANSIEVKFDGCDGL